MINETNVKLYCCENISLIENYDVAINSEELYVCHHRAESEENKTKKQLIEEERYYQLPATDLIFLSLAEHKNLHMLLSTFDNWKYCRLGKKDSEETKLKKSIAFKKQRNTEEYKHMYSVLAKNNPTFNVKGRHWYNNGIEEVLEFECPEGYKPGRSRWSK